MKIAPYIALLKFRYHVSFILVIIGTFLYSGSSFYLLIKPLFVAYISFNVLLYGGLYTLNDIADIGNDKKHPGKKKRPLASGQVSIFSAFAYAVILVAGALFISYYYFNKEVFAIYLIFIAINLIYTYFVKKIPYAEILGNSLTYPLRLVLGIVLAGGTLHYALLANVFFLAVGIACSRRYIEWISLDFESRPILRYYNRGKLLSLQAIVFSFILLIALVNYPRDLIWYFISVIVYLIFVFGAYYFRTIHNFYRWLWLN